MVRPASAQADIIAVSAPKAEDLIQKLERFESLDDAVSDCVRVVGLTARSRKGSWVCVEPTPAAQEALRMMESGSVALLFGREDSGLPNDALDRCDQLVTIPTDPQYSSMNLGQAVLLMCWEVFRCQRAGEQTSVVREDVRPDTEFEAASRGQTERLFSRIEETLEFVDFFKGKSGEHVLRSIRSVLLRAQMDRRELAIWLGVFKEIPAFVRRQTKRENDDF